MLAACGKLGVATRLSLARLRLLGPVVLHGPQAIHTLFDYFVARDCGWRGLVVGDLDLVHLHWGENSLGAGVAALPAWVALVRGDPGLWLRGLARVEHRATAAHVGECLRVVWCRTLDGILYQGCLDLPEGSAAVEVERGVCATNAAAPLPLLALLALGVPIGRGCTAPGTLLGPWRLARRVVVVEWNSIPGRDCCGISRTYSMSACLAAYASFFEPCDDATVDVAE